MTRPSAALALAASVFTSGCSEPELGDLPARCPDGQCPHGYTCIHEVCARPGNEVPITVARTDFTRGIDLKILPHQAGVLLTWQAKSYAPKEDEFIGARVTPEGVVSSPMLLVDGAEVAGAIVDPFYDVLRFSTDELLLTVSAWPMHEETATEVSAAAATPRTIRLQTFRVTLPAEGDEAEGARSEAAWPKEQRMATVGYAAVSRPKLVQREDGDAELAYVRTLPKTESTEEKPALAAELVVYRLARDGTIRAEPAVFPVRSGMSVAVSVASGFSTSTGTWWMLDDVRPSAVLVSRDTGTHAEVELSTHLGMALDAGPAWLSYLGPSERIGNKLPNSRVSGDASIHRLTTSPREDHQGVEISEETTATEREPPRIPGLVVRDTPRPAWITRQGKLPLLVTPGADIDSRELFVYAVDVAANAAKVVAAIDRMSWAPLTATQAVVAGGKLYIAWIDATEVASTIRMAIVPEP